uniref:CYTOSOL_AP domain-containing protein n=1 Tax=Caenorhabditis tropicalis TaxID=1561998 RepID=A0A1I7TBD6_9PELO
MAQVLVRKGIQAVSEEATSLVIIGKKSVLQSVPFEGRFQEVLQKYVGDASSWSNMLSRINSGRFPLHYELAHLIAVSDSSSRGNTSTNSHSLFRELRTINYPEDVKNVQIVLFSDYSDIVAHVAAISRCFYKFSLKTYGHRNKLVAIDVVCDPLTHDDVHFLTDLSDSVRETGRLIDTPANVLTTDKLVEEAFIVGQSLGAKMTVVRGSDLQAAGFGGIYHVGKAGPTPPAFVVLSHEVPGSTENIALVGKGVVYDTGGLQIKSKTGMPNMKRDMGGAAGVLQAFSTLVKSGFSQTLHACLCIVENNVSPFANKPDDVIQMLSGKTVEINNTDAEGRLILADGVFYARETLHATTIIDMATLTGAQAHLSGRYHGAAMTNDEELEADIIRAGKKSGDLVAPMLFAPDLFYGDLKSPIADMRNSNLGKMEGPPSAVAGLFIGAHIDFGDGLRWLHLDIAAPAECGDRGTGYGPALFSTLFGKYTKVPILNQ